MATIIGVGSSNVQVRVSASEVSSFTRLGIGIRRFEPMASGAVIIYERRGFEQFFSSVARTGSTLDVSGVQTEVPTPEQEEIRREQEEETPSFTDPVPIPISGQKQSQGGAVTPATEPTPLEMERGQSLPAAARDLPVTATQADIEREVRQENMSQGIAEQLPQFESLPVFGEGGQVAGIPEPISEPLFGVIPQRPSGVDVGPRTPLTDFQQSERRLSQERFDSATQFEQLGLVSTTVLSGRGPEFIVGLGTGRASETVLDRITDLRNIQPVKTTLTLPTATAQGIKFLPRDVVLSRSTVAGRQAATDVFVLSSPIIGGAGVGALATAVPAIGSFLGSTAGIAGGSALLASDIVLESQAGGELLKTGQVEKVGGRALELAGGLFGFGKGFKIGAQEATVRFTIPRQAGQLSAKGTITPRQEAIIKTGAKEAFNIPKLRTGIKEPSSLEFVKGLKPRTRSKILKEVRLRDAEITGSGAQELQLTKPRKIVDLDVAFKNQAFETITKVGRGGKIKTKDLPKPELADPLARAVGGKVTGSAIRGGEVKLDIKPSKRLGDFLFRGRTVRTPSGQKITNLQEQFIRKLSGSVDPQRIQRKGTQESEDVFRILSEVTAGRKTPGRKLSPRDISIGKLKPIQSKPPKGDFFDPFTESSFLPRRTRVPGFSVSRPSGSGAPRGSAIPSGIPSGRSSGGASFDFNIPSLPPPSGPSGRSSGFNIPSIPSQTPTGSSVPPPSGRGSSFLPPLPPILPPSGPPSKPPSLPPILPPSFPPSQPPSSPPSFPPSLPPSSPPPGPPPTAPPTSILSPSPRGKGFTVGRLFKFDGGAPSSKKQFFDVFVKPGKTRPIDPRTGKTVKRMSGKTVKANRVPLTRTEALDLGSNIADTSLGASFKIRRRGKLVSKTQKAERSRQARRIIPTTSFDFIRPKFREAVIRKGKKIKTPNSFIEKRSFRLDTRGETNRISVAKRVAELKKQSMGLPIMKLPRRKKGRASPSLNIASLFGGTTKRKKKRRR